MSDDAKKDEAPPEAPPSAVTSNDVLEPNRKPKTILGPPTDKMLRSGWTRGYLTK